LCEQTVVGARVPADRIRVGRGSIGIERLEASFRGQAFSSHRHDAYAIGITLSGVQMFRYRGEQRRCLPNQCTILHPDEVHDGESGTDTGFSYRIAYIDPALVQEALGGKALPFIADPLVHLTPHQKDLLSRIWDMEDEIDEAGRIEIAAAVADALETASSNRAEKRPVLAFAGLSRVRDMIAATPAERRAMNELERVAGLDRWTLARQFRAAFGTSPSRFRTMRQLDHVRRSVERGASLVAAALEAGFADQCHMSRMFKRTYGLTPGRWAAALA